VTQPNGIPVIGVEGSKERTHKHPLTWICSNCVEPNTKHPTRFTSDYPECPRCGTSGFPGVRIMSLIHLMVPSKFGPLKGQHGRRYFLACDPQREHGGTPENREAITNKIQVINCVSCLAWVKKNVPSGIKDTLQLSVKE
jgi:hypothetical protein